MIRLPAPQCRDTLWTQEVRERRDSRGFAKHLRRTVYPELNFRPPPSRRSHDRLRLRRRPPQAASQNHGSRR